MADLHALIMNLPCDKLEQAIERPTPYEAAAYLKGHRDARHAAAELAAAASAGKAELLEALKDCAEALAHLQDRLAVKVNPPTLENARALLKKHEQEN